MVTRVMAAGLLGVGSFAAALTPSVAQAAPVPFPISSGGTGSTYDVVVNPNASHMNAAGLASAAGGHLVTITSASEQAFIESLLVSSGAPSGGYWMGLVRGSNGDFGWTTGEAFSFDNFAQNEPNDVGGIEDFGHVYWTENLGDALAFRRGGWNDAPEAGYAPGNLPDLVRTGFIIEVPGAAGENPNPIPLPPAVFAAPLTMMVAGYLARRARRV